jgi:hypothetical protein
MELIKQGVYMFYEFDLTQRLTSFAVYFHKCRWKVRRDMQSNFTFFGIVSYLPMEMKISSHSGILNNTCTND